MSKEFFVINETTGFVVYIPGHYDQADAAKVAERSARQEPGVTFSVLQRVEAYLVERLAANDDREEDV